jgi:hypothetical protein
MCEATNAFDSLHRAQISSFAILSGDAHYVRFVSPARMFQYFSPAHASQSGISSTAALTIVTDDFVNFTSFNPQRRFGDLLYLFIV